MASYDQAPQSLLLDIDDTADETHGTQQQVLFNGYYDSYCYLPLHLYEGQSGKLITTILRPGRRPTGQEIVSILKRVVAALRHKWPNVLILLRGDGHFSTSEVHDWCESQSPEISYILSQSGNKTLKEKSRGLLQQAQLLYLESRGDPNYIDKYDQSLLYISTVAKGGYEVLELLIEYGADPNLGCASYMPLMNAASYSPLKSLKLLVKSGADILRQNADGQTALDMARNVTVYGPFRDLPLEVIEYLSKIEKEAKKKVRGPNQGQRLVGRSAPAGEGRP